MRASPQGEASQVSSCSVPPSPVSKVYICLLKYVLIFKFWEIIKDNANNQYCLGTNLDTLFNSLKCCVPCLPLELL